MLALLSSNARCAIEAALLVGCTIRVTGYLEGACDVTVQFRSVGALYRVVDLCLTCPECPLAWMLACTTTAIWYCTVSVA
eukprot:4374540-Prymnesium_polylepis.2